MTPISPELRALLADWLAWVERGAPEGEPYKRWMGLCEAVAFAFDGNRIITRNHLRQAFSDDALSVSHPFGYDEYWLGRQTNTQHLDPNRLAWVRAKLAEPS